MNVHKVHISTELCHITTRENKHILIFDAPCCQRGLYNKTLWIRICWKVIQKPTRVLRTRQRHILIHSKSVKRTKALSCSLCGGWLLESVHAQCRYTHSQGRAHHVIVLGHLILKMQRKCSASSECANEAKFDFYAYKMQKHLKSPEFRS